VSTDKPKSASKTGAQAPAEPSSKSGATGDKSTGRVKFDERGNAVWEWQIATGAFGREVSTARLKKLQNPTLSIADDAPTPFDKVRANPQGTKKGYDPYDSGRLGKSQKGPQKDLQRLSDWLKAKQQAALNKDEEPKD
jgi:hypothetical protein